MRVLRLKMNIQKKNNHKKNVIALMVHCSAALLLPQNQSDGMKANKKTNSERISFEVMEEEELVVLLVLVVREEAHLRNYTLQFLFVHHLRSHPGLQQYIHLFYHHHHLFLLLLFLQLIFSHLNRLTCTQRDT
jgi:hypothetical protein